MTIQHNHQDLTATDMTAKDFTGDRTRGLPGAQPDKATAGDVYRMEC
jgi:hypothetical protein